MKGEVMDATKKIKWTISLAVFILAFSAPQVFGQSCCPDQLPNSTGITVKSDSSASATDFTVPTLDGGTFTLSAQRGKPVVMFIMASWCAICYKEAEELAKLFERYKDRISILALDIDPLSTQEDLASFKERVGNPDYTWAFDRGGNVARNYKIKALDTTIIFDKNGQIVFTDLRSTSYRTLSKQIKLVLN